MSQDGLRTRKLCQSPMPDHCCNSGIIRGASPRCFPYTITQLLLKSQHVMRDTALEFGLPSGTGKLIQLLLDAGTSSCTRLPPPTDGIFPTPRTQPHMFYSTGVTNELVRTLGLSDKTPPGLPGLKPSSNSVLPVAWITRPATDLRLTKNFILIHIH